jgi:hypothetical protein
MNGPWIVPPARLVLVLGSFCGLLAGATAAALADTTTARRAMEPSPPAMEATHLPPLLTTAGERARLEYEVFCVGGEADAEEAGRCAVEGRVFVRLSRGGAFAEIPLQSARTTEGRRLVAVIPDEVSAPARGFEYFAVLRAQESGETLTIPAGGASAPHSSIRLERPIEVRLGAHPFERARRASERVAAASWGDGAADVGLEDGRNLSPIGASAFDVDRTGAVYLLDQARRRVLRWDGRAKSPTRIPVSVSGTLADMTVSSDGSIYVLETVGRPGERPVVRRFDGDGRELERVEIAERTASQIRMGRDGPAVLQQPSHQWMPITAGGAVADAGFQREHGRAGRPLPAGGEAIVLRHENEVRVALIGANGLRRSWRVLSDTPLGEVQLAEPLGNRVVVVVRTFTDSDAAFLVLLLDGSGLAHRFSLEPSDWAESAPLGRFRLVGSSLYQLGSTTRGVFVDRFDLKVGS